MVNKRDVNKIMLQTYRRVVREAKESIDKTITTGQGIQDHAMYKYMVGRSVGLQDALKILDEIQTRGVKENEH
jgi:hypothetical protein